MNTDTPQGWRPEPGAILVGKVLELNAGWSDYHNSSYPIVVIADERNDGTPIAVHAFHQVLWRRLAQLKPKTGERIAIKYDGQTSSKDGKRKISLYSVKIDGRSAEIDWNAMQPPGPAVATTPVVTQQDFQLPEGDTPDDDMPF
ncbi:MAG TPA: hypothetical protein VM715_12785 [Candidatus Acidoferrum sp.]|nr:hypothetical protein [Candidatus Acidoferrum sp.]